MLTTIQLLPGITLRCFPDNRFKQGVFSLQFVRPMDREEATMNALLPAVLLRGSEDYPDMRSVTQRQDELYGANFGTLVRRVGDYQTSGLCFGFLEDAYTLGGEKVFAPCMALLGSLLRRPKTEKDGFCPAYVEGERKNLISTLESQRNDKPAYAMSRLLQRMGKADSFGISRLGDQAHAKAIDPKGLYQHYQRLLRESEINLFYVGSKPIEEVSALSMALFDGLERDYTPLPPQTKFHQAETFRETEKAEIAQSRLCMGFTTPVTVGTAGFAAMQVYNQIFGGGMQNKLFTRVREQLHLCYDIGSTYHSAKGLLCVYAGIDSRSREQVEAEVLGLLQSDFTPAELNSAKKAICASLQAVHDTTGSIENYYGTAALSGLGMTPEEYRQAVEQVTAADVMKAAKQIQFHSIFFLQGEEG